MFRNGRSFLRKFICDPHGTGAVAPATRSLARSVARTVCDAYQQHADGGPGEPLRVVELGAGTGALTQGISPLNPLVIERDEAWAALLRRRFPALEVRQQCALCALDAIREPTAVVSSIPLINNPQAADLREALEAKYAQGLVKFCVLYTYGWVNPLAGAAFRDARRASFVPRSLPPAHVWIYQ